MDGSSSANFWLPGTIPLPLFDPSCGGLWPSVKGAGLDLLPGRPEYRNRLLEILQHQVDLVEQFTHPQGCPNNEDTQEDLGYGRNGKAELFFDGGGYRRKVNERKKGQEDPETGIVAPEGIDDSDSQNS